MSDTEPSREAVDKMSGKVLLEFGATWCPICQALKPHLLQALTRFPDVKHLSIEDGRGKPLGRSFQVKLWPNLVFLKDGTMVDQLVRPSVDEMEKALQNF